MIRPEPGDESRPTSQTGEPSPWDTYGAATPANGVPVTPRVDDRPTQAIPVVDPYAAQDLTAGQYERTIIQPVAEPVVPVARVYAAAPQTYAAAAVAPENVYLAPPDDRPPWIVIAAVIALLLGGLVGFLIGHSSAGNDSTVSTTGTVGTLDTTDPATADAADARVNDIFTLLAAQARQDGGIQTPTPYPALDDLLGVLSAGAAPTSGADTTVAPAVTGGSSAATDQLQAQVDDLQNQLTATQAALAAAQQTASTGGGTSADTQAQLDDQAQQIATLQKNLDKANADLQTAQGQLASATKTLGDLDPKPVDNFVGTDIAKVRTTAKANGWTLIEQSIESATEAVGTVTAQTPATGTTMVKGGVLYVEVAAAPGSTG